MNEECNHQKILCANQSYEKIFLDQRELETKIQNFTKNLS